MSDETHPKPNAYPPELKAMNKALSAAQGEMPAIPKTKTVDTGTFTYEYAPLDVILAAVRPVLAKHGLALIQRLENPSGGKPSIRTELRHADGGVIAASFPLGEWKTPQQLGSTVSYHRRYAVVSMLGIATEEEDDDGRLGAATQKGSSSSAAIEESPFQPPDLQDKADFMEDLSAAQRKKIFALKTKLTNAGLFDDEGFKGQLYMSFGVDSVTGLSKEQASELINRLLKAEEKLEVEDASS